MVKFILSHTAVREGIALFEEGLSPYAGDIFHEVILVIVQFCLNVMYSVGTRLPTQSRGSLVLRLVMKLYGALGGGLVPRLLHDSWVV